MSSVIVQILSPEGVTIAFEASSLEGAHTMIKSLITQGYKPVASAAPEGAPRAAELRPLTRQLEALCALVEGLHAPAPAVSAVLPPEALAPLVAVVAQLAAVVQRLEALAVQLPASAPGLLPASVPVVSANGVQRVPRQTAPGQASSPPRDRILAYLREVGPQRPYEVDAALGLPKSRDLLRRLAVAGVVCRTPEGCYAVAAGTR